MHAIRGKDLNEPLVGIIKSDMILACFSVAVMKNTNQEQIGREKAGFPHTHPAHIPSLREARKGALGGNHEILTDSHTG